MRVQWARAAVRDLRDAEAYIAADSPLYARRYVSRILASTRKLSNFPRLGRKVPEAGTAVIREIIVRPYRVIYRLTRDRILILAEMHASQDLSSKKPKPWEAG